MSNRNFYLACGAIFMAGVATIYLVQKTSRRWPDSIANVQQERSPTENDGAASQEPSKYDQTTGQISRKPDRPKATSSLPSVGQSPLVPANENRSTRSISQALEADEYPERYSSYLAPAPFDLKKFKADPESYLKTVEPGRIYQSAQPGKNVPRIQIQSSAFSNLVQGEKVFFRVKVTPQAPVTFHSSEMGEFSNRLSTITVQADDEGIANVEFATTRGMQGIVNVLAASPQTSGQAHFYVNVNLPARNASRTRIAESSN